MSSTKPDSHSQERTSKADERSSPRESKGFASSQKSSSANELKENACCEDDSPRSSVSQGHEDAWERPEDYEDDAEMAVNIEQLRAVASQYLEDGQQRLQETKSQLEQQIRTRPWRAISVTAGVSFLLGAIWSRRW